MGKAIRIVTETVRSLAHGGIGAAYIGVGTTLSKPARIFFLQNLTNGLLMFSFDGVNDHFPMATNSYFLLDIASNKILSDGFFLAEGERLYVKEITAPTSGSVYFTVFYGAS